jgi:hypothetical protein
MIDKTAFALSILRENDAEKIAGALGTIANVLKAGDRGGAAAAKYLADKGHHNLALGARVAPHAAALYGAKKAYDSGPVQKVRRKYQEHKIRKAMRAAQQGY